ncbi:MAG: ABC transporter ATP-binding protein [Candidatus Izemoplasmataceae bacterium]
MPHNKLKTLKRLIKGLFLTDKKAMVSVFIALVFASAGIMSISVFIQMIIDSAITPSLGEGWNAAFDALLPIVIAMVIVYTLALIGTTVYTQIMAKVGQHYLDDIRKAMFEKMESLPIGFFDARSHGDIMSYYTNDVDTLRQFVTQTLIQFAMTLFTMVFVIGTMLYYSFFLTLFVAIGGAIMFKLTKVIGGKSVEYFRAQQQSMGKVEGYIEEMMHGQKVVKTFVREERAKKDFDAHNEVWYEDSKNARHYGNILMPILHNIGNLMYVLLAIIGSVLIYYGVTNVGFSGIYPFSTARIGIVVSFLSLSRQFAQNIRIVSQQAPMVGMALGGASRVYDFLGLEEEKDSGYVRLVHAKKAPDGHLVETEEETGLWAWKYPHGDGTITYHELKGDIVLENVDFEYVPGTPVLNDVSIYARPGETIALVGHTGAGKTTITNLINRFYEIRKGKIRYDGINIQKIRKPDLRRSLGMVLQDTNLFTGTVRDNIRYGRMDASEEEVIEAAKTANAYDFIRHLPKGFDTELSANGENLSQGQRQLLSIARAACANAPVLILDEATSSIDTRTEALVQEGMNKLMEGRTVFVIAHRLSTVKSSDAIMVMDHGRIIERGSHDSLIDQKGTYYELYTGALRNV